MYEPLRRRVLALLRVPPEPHPPIGEPASLRVFRAGRSFYQLRIVGWATTQIFVLLAFLLWTAVLFEVENRAREQKALRTAAPAADPITPNPAPEDGAAPPSATKSRPTKKNNFTKNFWAAAKQVNPAQRGAQNRSFREWVARYIEFFVELALLLPPWVFPLLWVVKIVSFLLYVIQLPLTYAVRRLDYEMRWYMVTDRSLRLRHGVWKITESTMSFANVQQVVVSQGPIQRLLGLADLKVQSAGGGSAQKHEQAGDDLHVGWFRHVTNAPEIRDLILDRLRRFRESGIGDPDDAHAVDSAAPSSSGDPTLEAARELLAEARALRATVS